MNVELTQGKRVFIPHNVADAIEKLRTGTGVQYDNARIVAVTQNENFNGETPVALRTIPFDTLLAALVNGYEREKTAEEIAEEERQSCYASVRDYYNIFEGVNPIAYEARRYAIKGTLNLLGISIEGVNA